MFTEFQAKQKQFIRQQQKEKGWIIQCVKLSYIQISMLPDAAVPPWVGYNEEEQMKTQILALSSVCCGLQVISSSLLFNLFVGST